ncbi:MAG: hypothetical protein A2452_12775 [Candidatus Firestonebacteria bacterium RIFOXYC2_FULL_39_67]|nr:MAG: hypothetical protein A2536_12140 [Candidatus Firestonebacteria bacterium RIFOXYD2_FULL_39_29]OGF52816.1 MAG: hypothetical protein A2497_00930 [Candidatus Firestonebacteria bacterium RifOxyC12_full_39_7]OGF57437.1 MAG: hypothetical protein A2452_12775 [Candidatus Firestonebacteria bacterium RIFOXYC2_FULL_39_67]
MLKNILLATVCVFIFSGCYYTIEPIYTAKDIISDDAILGKWGDPKTKVRWTFTKDEKNKYNAQYLGNDGIESAFEITLVKLGKFKYLDMFVDNKKPENKNGEYKALLLGCHFYIRYTVDNDRFTFVNYALGWIEKKLKDKELDLHYFKRDAGYYFSDSTESLQKVIISLEDTKEAFAKDPQVLEKIK